MEIFDGRGLIFQPQHPQQILETINKSAILADGRVLVHWNMRAAQTLTRLGYRAPSAILKSYNYPGRDAAFEHQKRMAEFMTLHKRCFNFSEMGCVDSDTEYLSPTGWVRIAEYESGAVAQYDPHAQRIEFVEPAAYIKKPCSAMLKIQTKYGIDQMLSLEHRVLLTASRSEMRTEVISAQELLERHNAWFHGENAGRKKGKIAYSKAAIPCTFSAEGGAGLQLSDAALRVQVAVIVDGSFPNKNNKCVVRVKKERKQQRLRTLLAAANIQYSARPCKPEGFLLFKFDAPIKVKEFDARFWAASVQQCGVIADEVLHWDGSVIDGKSFFSNSKASADFVQYVFSSSGRTARVSAAARTRCGKTTTEYAVRIRDEGFPLMLCSKSSDGERRKIMSLVPSTDGFKYCFSVPSTFLLFRRNGCIFASGNTGKSRSVLWAADYLMTIGMVKRALVIGPLSILDTAWVADHHATAMHRTIGVAVGDGKRRDKIINSGCEFCIINHDGVKSSFKELKRAKFDLIVVDEATAFCNTQTDRWKALNNLLREDTLLWMLTGTPAANSPLQAYGLAKLVSPERVPKFFTGWKDQTMLKVSTFTYVARDNAKDTVFNALQPAIRFEKKDCFELPPVTYTERVFDMEPQQLKYYNSMKAQMRIITADKPITAVNSGVLMGKLMQIACGTVYSDDGSVIDFRANTRLNELLSVVQECEHKVLVFAQYRHSINAIGAFLEKHGIECAIIDGSTSQSARKMYIDMFQNTGMLKVLILQPKVAAHGLTLTRASAVVWFNPVASLETWRQANDRINRWGQLNPMTIVKLVGSLIERKVYTVLEKRDATQAELLDLYRQEVNL